MSAPRLRDRLNGRRHAPVVGTALEPARYLVETAVTFNSHTRLDAGAVLLDDGSAQWRLGGLETIAAWTQPADAEDFRLALDALAAIDAGTDLAAGAWPSPLLPAALGHQSTATGLETTLAEVFECGHLETIAARPRLTMRYDTALLPVERAQRLDGAFQRHLAAHSDCWASRTLSGIVPKRVLARISEDEADRYEHRVYARLLDHLERTLGRRLGRLEALDRSLICGLDFDASTEVDYRLRHDICTIWGEAQTGGNTDQRTRNAAQIARLRRWRKRLRGLQAGALYAAIPRAAEVGLSLKATNLLQHDVHYRALHRLWNAWLVASAGERERPAQVLERRRGEQARYERYVGLLLLRALKNLGFAVTMDDATHGSANHPGRGERLAIRFDRHDWHVAQGDRQLVLVPAAVALDAAASAQWRTHEASGSVRVPCVLQMPEALETGEPCARLMAGAPALPLSPLDLYAEEAMTALLAGWLWQSRVVGYGEVFERLPGAVLAAWPEPAGSDSGGRALTRPLDAAAWERLDAALAEHANGELRERIEQRRRQFEVLVCCPDCAAPAAIFTPEPHGFYARCGCGCVWQLRDGRFGLTRADQPDAGFAQLGRRRLDVALADAVPRSARPAPPGGRRVCG